MRYFFVRLDWIKILEICHTVDEYSYFRNMIEKLNLPEYNFNIKQENQRKLIFDPLRKKHVVLTPEEWVRQNFIQFLIHEKAFPQGRIAVERALKLNQMSKRSDILIYDAFAQAIALVECKAPHIKIQQSTFDQAARYNLVLQVPYLLITNGMEHFCAHINIENSKIQFLKEIPNYTELKF